MRVGLEELRHGSGLASGAHEEHRPEVVAAGAHPPRRQAEQDLLRREEEEVQGAEDDEEPSAHELEAQAVHDQSEERRSAERHAGRRPDFLPERERPVASIEAGGVEQETPDREDERQEEEVLLEGVEGLGKETGEEPRENYLPEDVGERKRNGREYQISRENTQGDRSGLLLQHRLSAAALGPLKPPACYEMRFFPSRTAS